MSDWKPNPKQELALKQSVFEVLYGGARGGGKTDAGLAFLMYDKDHPLYRALVIRKNADDLKDWADRAERFYARAGAERKGSPAEIHFPKGAVIRTGHLKDANAYMKYQGHEYQKMKIEELNQIPSEESYLKLIASCRSSVPDLTPQIFATANPGGPGHKWVKNRWRIPDEPGDDPIFTKDPGGRWRVFIPAYIRDNPQLMNADPGYVQFLKSLPDGLRQQWLDGSWAEVDLKGAYYTNEVRQLIREKRYKFVPHEPLLPVHTVWDLGQSAGNAMAIGFWQVISGEARLIAYYSNESQGFPHYFVVMQEYQRERGYRYGKHFAPFDMNVKELGTGKTRLQVAKEAGWDFEIVDSLSIADGIEQVRLLFPKMWINTEYGGEAFLDAIRQYHRPWDDLRQTYKLNPYHDWTSNPADMLRYTAISFKKMLAANAVTKKVYRQAPYTARSPYEGGQRPGGSGTIE